MRSGSPAEPVSDAELIGAHLAGDREAFGELFRRHQTHLWAVSLRVCGNPDDAADALQDGIIRAMRGAGQFQGRAAPGTWLHRIITNAAIDLLRSRHPVVGLDELPELVDRTEMSPQATWDASVDLERAFAAIPAQARVAVYLVDYEGWSVADVAAVLGVAPGTVKSRCSRARAQLAPLLAGYGNRNAPAAVKPSHPSKEHPGVTRQRSDDE